MLEEFTGAALRGLVVWVPMMDGDDETAAHLAASSFGDDRVSHSWDPERQAAAVFGGCLELQGPAWDVYLLYEPGVVWAGGAPPRPSFKMFQLPEKVGADPSFLLNPGRLAEELGGLLGLSPRRADLALRLHAKALAAARGAPTSQIPGFDRGRENG